MQYFAQSMLVQPETMVQLASQPISRSVQGKSSNIGWVLPPAPPQAEQTVPGK